MIFSEHDANFYALDKQVIMFFIMSHFSINCCMDSTCFVFISIP